MPWALAALAVFAMMKDDSLELRQLERELIQSVASFDRFVDIGVTLIVVAQDPNGKETDPRKLPEVTRRSFGGIVDTKHAQPHVCDRSERPVTWFCSEDQYPLIVHPDSAPRGQLVIGSEGAGKTTALAQWHYLRWLENLGERREGGQTAPVLKRLGLVRSEIDKLWPAAWKRYVARDDFEGYELCDGSRIRFQHTHRQSEAQGSPIQGFNWSWCGRDETQDQVEVHEDIENRGRAAKNGGTYYKQFGTATAKNDPDWRSLRDKLETARGDSGQKLWSLSMLFGRRSPFIARSFWDVKKQTMSFREYQRRVECKDLGPELATYEEFSRDVNLITVPEIGWTDVTAHELRASAPNRHLLVGHDPGSLWQVSLPINAFVRNQDYGGYMRGAVRPFWVVRGEINNEQSTTDAHLVDLLKFANTRHLNLLTHDGKPNPLGKQMLVRADPASEQVNDSKTHKSVYTKFANAGIHIKPAAYNAENDGHGKVPKDPGIEVIKTLFANAAEMERRQSGNYQPAHFSNIRLYVERREDGTPAAPMLVKAIERCERDAYGKAETTKKGPADMSHWTAALRYALWAIERPRLKQIQGSA